MNNTLIKDFILDCLNFKYELLIEVYNEGFIDMERMEDFEERVRNAKDFINSLGDDEYIKDEKTELYVTNIMKKFDSIVENFKEK